MRKTISIRDMSNIYVAGDVRKYFGNSYTRRAGVAVNGDVRFESFFLAENDRTLVIKTLDGDRDIGAVLCQFPHSRSNEFGDKLEISTLVRDLSVEEIMDKLYSGYIRHFSSSNIFINNCAIESYLNDAVGDGRSYVVGTGVVNGLDLFEFDFEDGPAAGKVMCVGKPRARIVSTPLDEETAKKTGGKMLHKVTIIGANEKDVNVGRCAPKKEDFSMLAKLWRHRILDNKRLAESSEKDRCGTLGEQDLFLVSLFAGLATGRMMPIKVTDGASNGDMLQVKNDCIYIPVAFISPELLYDMGFRRITCVHRYGDGFMYFGRTHEVTTHVLTERDKHVLPHVRKLPKEVIDKEYPPLVLGNARKGNGGDKKDKKPEKKSGGLGGFFRSIFS